LDGYFCAFVGQHLAPELSFRGLSGNASGMNLCNALSAPRSLSHTSSKAVLVKRIAGSTADDGWPSHYELRFSAALLCSPVVSCHFILAGSDIFAEAQTSCCFPADVCIRKRASMRRDDNLCVGRLVECQRTSMGPAEREREWGRLSRHCAFLDWVDKDQ
jgi:hypothetical protein